MPKDIMQVGEREYNCSLQLVRFGGSFPATVFILEIGCLPEQHSVPHARIPPVSPSHGVFGFKQRDAVTLGNQP